MNCPIFNKSAAKTQLQELELTQQIRHEVAPISSALETVLEDLDQRVNEDAVSVLRMSIARLNKVISLIDHQEGLAR